jgi:hypothetical protein
MNAPWNRKQAGHAPVLALALGLGLGLLAASGCGSEEITLADAPPDATEKVLKAQPKPTKAQRLPPKEQMSQGRPY